jgi:hypothetical protein
MENPEMLAFLRKQIVGRNSYEEVEKMVDEEFGYEEKEGVMKLVNNIGVMEGGMWGLSRLRRGIPFGRPAFLVKRPRWEPSGESVRIHPLYSMGHSWPYLRRRSCDFLNSNECKLIEKLRAKGKSNFDIDKLFSLLRMLKDKKAGLAGLIDAGKKDEFEKLYDEVFGMFDF